MIAPGTFARNCSDGVIDLRLVPAAVAVWAATVLGLLAGWQSATILGLVAGCAAFPVWLVARSCRWANGLLVVLMVTAFAAGGVALRVHQVEWHPLGEVADRGGTATVRVVLGDGPQPLQGASYGASKAADRALVRAELRTATIAGRRLSVGGELIMLVPTEQWRGLIAGQTVTVTGRLMPPKSGELVVAAMRVSGPPSATGAAPGWQQTAEGLRNGLRRSSVAVLSPAAAGLLPGLVVGDTGSLPPEVVDEFNTAGLAHLTAVSGANLAIVCGAVLLLLRWSGVGPVGSAVGAGGSLVGFVVLAGPEPSVLRAAVMGAITLLALVLGRDRSALPALAASVIGLVLFWPGLSTSMGFALSVAATAGLVLLAPRWSAALHSRGVPVGVAEAVAVPAAAHVVTAPLVAAFAGEVSAVAVLANLVAGPAVAPATVLGVLATVVAPLSGWSAEALVWLSSPALEWVLMVAHRAAGIPGAAIRWPSGTGGGLLLAVLSAMVLILLRIKHIRWVFAALVLVAGVVLVPVRVLEPGWPTPGWSMVVCDVGQGDGMVLSTGQPGEAVVVDTGPEPAVNADCLRRLGVHKVPLVVLTHLHADHVGGLASVLADRGVGAVGISGLHEPAWAMADLVRDTRARGIRVVTLHAGQRLRWPGLTLDVLAPVGSLARASSAEQANDASLVLRATTPAGRLLLTGDIELIGQSQLLASGLDLRADVLKVPHHGSRYTTPRFLRAVRPRVAVISVGDGNTYGHPSPLVVGALTRAGTRVLRTDHEGDIAVLPGQQGPRTASRGDPIRADDP